MSRKTMFDLNGLGCALNDEWERVLCQQSVPARWRIGSAELVGCRTYADVLAAVCIQPDPVLGALLRLRAGGELVPGRVVLQAMLGKLIRMAAHDPDAGLDDYVSAMWLRISLYPLADRPVRIAANLALDTLKTVRRASGAQPAFEVTPFPPSAFVDSLMEPAAEPPEDDPDAARVLLTAARLGLIDDDTTAVLRTVYAEGLTGASAAVRHGKSAGAIRVQCHKAVRRLAEHRALLLEAA